MAKVTTDSAERAAGGRSRASREAGQRSSSNETRDAILQAARQRFLHYGFKKTTIDDIAGDAGVGKGTVYLYFEGKDEIMLTLVLEVKRSINALLERLEAGDGPAEERLEQMVLACVLTVYDACTAAAHGNEFVDNVRIQLSQLPHLRDAFRNEHHRQLGLIASVIRQGEQGGTFETEDPEQAASLLTAAFASFFPPYINPLHPTPRDRSEIEAGARRMFGFLMTGLQCGRGA